MADAKIVDVTVGRPLPDRLTVHLTEPVRAGCLLRIRGGDLPAAMSMKLSAVRAGGRELAVVHRHSMEDQLANWDFYTTTFTMAVVLVDADLPAGTPLELDISARPAGVSGVTWTVSAGLVDDPRSLKFRCVSDSPGIRFLAGQPKYIEACLKAPATVSVEQFDALGNPAQSDGATINVTAGGRDVDVEPTAGLPATRIELPWAAAVRALRASVTDSAGRSAATNARPVTDDGEKIYFGEIHWHCHVSCDGERDLAEALTSARDELCLDFAGPADHMNCDGRYYTPLTTRYQADVCRSFDEPGRFCTIPGAELGGRGGHANVYCDSFETFLGVTDRFEAELQPLFRTHLFNFRALSRICPAGKAVVAPHHPNANSGGVGSSDRRPLWNAIHWPMPADRKAVRLLEIVQASGAYETEEADEKWRIRVAGLGGSARTALMRGYRLGFTGATDNHSGWPARGRGTERVGLTAVLARKLDTKSIFKALHARRCYATSGPRIVAWATCNGRPMGSELKLAIDDRPELCISIHGTAPLTHVQIVHMGYVLADLPVQKDCLDFDATWADERPGRPLDDAYYYIRARQQDGHCVWLSPFWIDLKE
ncbi:MAG TPA: hypothetical protein VM098_02505 [Phycisphaerae bacterium]|nr:hypothetical protein [Phycisphaerae bacterium]